ncbi:terminase large subunit [Paroceanicella profunda]|uniref:Terminase large subunit n=1 Tax=Paroceanicella profunda TaxID=2579971 RepID=A0A5B8G0D9_9RHOB|nr:terminase large subunit [Paroceanicella profunda]QDL92539.1 terminase large subunit [Paroceanicella profunda]
MAFDGWDFSCPDWADRLRDGRSLVPHLPLDTAAADQAVAIFDRLRLPDVVGQPAMAEAAGDWFRDIIRAAFGSIDPESGQRRVAEIFALVPKKNSKTTNAAAMGLVAMLANRRPNAEMLVVGPTQDVADLCFGQIQGMIEADPDEYLSKRFHVQEHLKRITCRITRAVLRVKTFDMRVMTGTKPVLVILDELHVMASSAFASRVVGQIRGGLLANPESLLVFITTQSDRPPTGVFETELKYARGVRDGVIREDVRMLPVLYEFPEAVQIDERKPWRDPKLWPMVLPNLGRSISIERLVSEYRGAIDRGIEEEARWASQHLNVQIGLALHTDRWVGADYWVAAGKGPASLDELLETSDVCTVGIDGGGLDDLLGAAVIGRHRETRVWRSWAHAWAHPIALTRRPENEDTLRGFERAGHLTICETPTQDVVEVAALVGRIWSAGLLPEKAGVGLDPNGVAAIVDAIAEEDVPDEVIAGVSQGWRLCAAIWGLERKLHDGTFLHDGSPMMAWCVGNARVEPRGNAVLITKQISGKAKIDPLMAVLDAAMLMAANPEAHAPGGRSYLEASGLMVL